MSDWIDEVVGICLWEMMRDDFVIELEMGSHDLWKLVEVDFVFEFEIHTVGICLGEVAVVGGDFVVEHEMRGGSL